MNFSGFLYFKFFIFPSGGPGQPPSPPIVNAGPDSAMNLTSNFQPEAIVLGTELNICCNCVSLKLPCPEDIFDPKSGSVHVHIPGKKMQLARAASPILDQKFLQDSAALKPYLCLPQMRAFSRATVCARSFMHNCAGAKTVAGPNDRS